MISETKFRVENHFRVEIFEIFHFQKHAPNMDNWRVKKKHEIPNYVPKRLLGREFWNNISWHTQEKSYLSAKFVENI